MHVPDHEIVVILRNFRGEESCFTFSGQYGHPIHSAPTSYLSLTRKPAVCIIRVTAKLHYYVVDAPNTTKLAQTADKVYY